MTNLTVKECDLLKRIDKRKESVKIFFQKVQGLKWYAALEKRGYFAPEANPRPKESSVEGRKFVPYWCVLDYLEKTSSELNENENENYSKIFRELLISVSKFAKEEQFSNYRTWWKFALIISNIPSKYLTETDLDIVDYWLDDQYDTSLVGEAIGTQWLPALLEQSDEHSQELAIKLVSLIFKVKLDPESVSSWGSNDVKIRIETFQCCEIIDQIAKPLGSTLGESVLPILESQIESVLEHSHSDKSSVIWRPAIEEHDQNQTVDNQIHLFIDLLRDTLNAFVASKPIESVESITKLLNSEFKTIKRIAIHAIDTGFQSCRLLFNQLLEPTFWTTYQYKHELWTLLNHHYPSLDKDQKESVRDSICAIDTDTDTTDVQSRAYRQAGWFAAIKEHGKKEEEAYQNCVKKAGATPEYPSFEAYMQWGQVVPMSPISLEQMSSMQTSELIDYLKNYREDNSNFFESPIEGLFEAFRKFIKSSPLSFSRKLSSFEHIDLRFIYQIVEAYRELWVAKSSLPWKDVWKPLLRFCLGLVSCKAFWNEDNAKFIDVMIPNRHWVVGSIASLIESGVKSDDPAFDSECLDIAEDIVVNMLEQQHGEEFEENDAVFNAINSPRGKCINALVNLTLRRCRDADALNRNKDHSAVWIRFEHFYDRELEFSCVPSFEVPTLFANYLPNLLYMSADWTYANLDRIFSQEDRNWWRCAMEGYAYVSTFQKKIYKYLRDAGHFIDVLDDETIYHRAHDRVITNICIAYLSGIESLDTDSDLVSVLISRNKRDELNKLVLEFWRYGKGDEVLLPKIKTFWAAVLSEINLESKGGQSVASNLCRLVERIAEVDDPSLNLIRAVAPYACVEHNSYHMFEWLEKLSESQPKESYLIWQSMIRFTLPSFPANSMKILLKNIVNAGYSAQAHELVETYIKGGNLELHKWLKEILAD